MNGGGMYSIHESNVANQLSPITKIGNEQGIQQFKSNSLVKQGQIKATFLPHQRRHHTARTATIQSSIYSATSYLPTCFQVAAYLLDN